LDEPAKNWKFSDADMKERAFWDDYQNAYAECLSATSADDAPWYVVPADDKKNTRLIVSSVIGETLRSLKLELPQPDPKLRGAMKLLRAQLTKPGN
jgi:polyphosphate kinase 2 (PPK2 family)